MKEHLNASICIWCGNKLQEACVAHCQDEGRYRYLTPATLPHWEAPPGLPPFRELMELPAIERLALVYLALAYAQQERERE